MDMMNELSIHKIIAIIRGIPRDLGDPTVEALAEGGIRFVEVTMNTAAATEMISNWKKRYGEKIRVGAGSVYDQELAKQALAAGAEYLISPNLDEKVIDYALSQGIYVFPGTMTPTEIYKAWKAGAHAVKVFPSGSLGVAYIKELQGPFGHIPMIATGGVNLENLADFIRAGAFAVGIGGNLIPKALILNRDFDRLRILSEQFCRKMKEIGENEGV